MSVGDGCCSTHHARGMSVVHGAVEYRYQPLV